MLRRLERFGEMKIPKRVIETDDTQDDPNHALPSELHRRLLRTDEVEQVEQLVECLA